jgi:membrane protease YdiL (CAAX protease family)
MGYIGRKKGPADSGGIPEDANKRVVSHYRVPYNAGMIRLSRPAKMLLSLLMTSMLLWSLYSARSAPVDGRREEGADLLALRLILLDLYTLEASSGIDPSLRQVRLRQLAGRLRVEAARSPQNAVLQAENMILQVAAGAYDSPLGELLGIDYDLDLLDTELKGLVRALYLGNDGGDFDAAPFLERLGESWFSLTAIIHYGERRGDRALTAESKARLGERSHSAVARLERLGLFVGGAALTGLFLWGRYFLVVRRPGLPRRERVLGRADWNPLDGYFVFLLLFCLFSGASWLLAPLVLESEGLALPPGSAVPILYLLQALLGLFLLQRFFFRGSFFDSLHRMGGAMGEGSVSETAAWGIGGYAATLPLVLVVLYLSSRFLGRPPVSSNPLIPLMMEASTLWEQLLFFLTVALLAPAFEEVFFRGFLFNAFRAKFGAPVGMVLSSLLFGLVHFDFAMFWGLFVIGMMLCFVYYHTQSLAAPMLLHGLWNTTTLVVVQTLFP